VYDGTALQLKEEWFKANLPNDVVIGDNHFSWARDRPGFPKFYANYAVPAQSEDMEGLAVLTEEKKKYNRAIAHARARIENIFGDMKANLFPVLSRPWLESKEQQTCLVFFAAAVHNRKHAF
jgi:hypothetical protein